MKRNRAWRRWKDKCIQNKRLKLIKQIWYNFADSEIKRLETKRHYLNKKHPCDCGKSKCYLCNYEKLMNIENPSDVKRSRVEDEEYYAYSING